MLEIRKEKLVSKAKGLPQKEKDIILGQVGKRQRSLLSVKVS